MLAKDIFRLVWLILFVAFALWSGARTRVPGSVQIKSPAEREDTEAQLMTLRLKDARDRIDQEPKGYQNKTRRKERVFSNRVNSSAGTLS